MHILNDSNTNSSKLSQHSKIAGGPYITYLFAIVPNATKYINATIIAAIPKTKRRLSLKNY